MNILVVGGAGYIGSHCVRQLITHGHNPIILDNLVFGHRAAVPEKCSFYQENLGDKKAVIKILKEEEIDLVMHFAAFAYVGESVTDPLKYYENNVINTLRLLEAMLECGVKQFVFSSTCATFGTPEKLPITEDTPQKPINPYGQTKLDIENALKALSHAHGLSFASMRYFNAAGATPDGSIGEDHDPETHLIPLIFDAIESKRENIKIFGTDYPTPDGTCLRDYIHVDDLAEAHILTFEKLKTPGVALFYNLGIGKPYSVREVIGAIEKITGKTVPVVESARRAGDPPALYADSSKAKKELGWKPKYETLESIVKTAYRWHKDNPYGFPELF